MFDFKILTLIKKKRVLIQSKSTKLSSFCIAALMELNFGRISGLWDCLLHCNVLASFDSFSILAYQNKKYLLETKESLSTMIVEI